jgi:TP901 family phage tail tape measure protein
MGALAVAGIAAVAIKSVSMASDFEKSTTRLVTSGGEQAGALKTVGNAMLKMAGDVGISAKALSEGMYVAESAGYHGAAGLKVLRASAEAAKIEHADLGHVVNAVTDILKDYHRPATDAAKVTSQMVEAISFGKTNLDDFSKSMATILPLAGKMHLSFADVASVEATMTAHGMSAAQSAVDIRQAMIHLSAPTLAQTKEWTALGVTQAAVNQKMGKEGLGATMQWLSEVSGKGAHALGQTTTEALKKTMGTIPAYQAALTTTGENAKDLARAHRGIAGAVSEAGDHVKGFALVQKTLSQQTDQLSAAFGSMMIVLGQKLLPIITSVVTWMNKHKDITLALLGVVAGLAAAVVTYTLASKAAAIATEMWSAAQMLLNGEMDANPIGLIVLAVAALVIGFIEAYKHSEKFRAIIQAIGKVAEVAFKAVVTAAEVAFAWLRGHWKLVATILAGPFAPAVYLITHHFGMILNAAKSVISWIQKSWHGLVNILEGPFRTAWAVISAILSSIGNAVSNTLGKLGGVIDTAKSVGSAVGGFLGFAHGGTIGAAASGGTRSGLTLVGEQGPELVHLPSGSHVMSNPDTRRAMSGGGGGDESTMVVVLQMDGHTLSKLLINPMRKTIRHIGGKGPGSVQAALGS